MINVQFQHSDFDTKNTKKNVEKMIYEFGNYYERLALLTIDPSNRQGAQNKTLN